MNSSVGVIAKNEYESARDSEKRKRRRSAPGRKKDSKNERREWQDIPRLREMKLS